MADVERVVDDLCGDTGLRVEGERLEVLGVPYLHKRAVLNLVTNALRRVAGDCMSRARASGCRWCSMMTGWVYSPRRARRYSSLFLRQCEPNSRFGWLRSGVGDRTADHGGTRGQIEVGESALGGARFTLIFPAG